MSKEEQRKLLQKHAQESRRWWLQAASESSRDEEFDEELRRRHWLNAARSYDFDATLVEELTVRLSGEVASSGGLDFGVGEAILAPLKSSVSSAMEKPTRLEIVGISAGSTVVHVRPRVDASIDAHSDELSTQVDSSSSDQAIREFLKAVNAAEEGVDVRQWVQIVEGVQRFAAALDKFDLTADFKWHALDGTTRVARLSDRGREYLRGLRTTEPAEDTIIVSGRVTELREAGVVKVKTGVAKNSTAYEVKVPTADLLRMHLEIGASVHFVVREKKETDKLGRVHATTFTFLRQAEVSDRLDLPS